MSKFVLSSKALENAKSSGMRKFLSGNKDLKRIYSSSSKRQALFNELKPLGSGGGVSQGEFKKVLSRIRTGKVKGLDSRYGKIMTNVARKTNYSFLSAMDKSAKPLVSEKLKTNSNFSTDSQKTAGFSQRPLISNQMNAQAQKFSDQKREANIIIDKDLRSVASNYFRISKSKSSGADKKRDSGNSDIDKLPG